jgi:hypothetical protein
VVKDVESSSSYQMGVFEALEFAWHLLRAQKEHSGSVDNAFSTIQEILAKVGKGGDVDFRKEISQLQ